MALHLNSTTVVIIDMETSGVSKYTSEVVQLSAKCEGNEYNAYIMPQRGMTVEASNINGITVQGGLMYYYGRRIFTTPARRAMTEFLDFLSDFQRDIVLAAHNGLKFDFPILIRELQRHGLMKRFCSLVKGFSDTLEIFKAALPARLQEGRRFNLYVLACDYGLEAEANNAHNALVDVRILRKLLLAVKISNQKILSYAKSVHWLVEVEDRCARKRSLKIELMCLKSHAYVSDYIIDKMAREGVCLHMLQDAYLEGGEEELADLLWGEFYVTKNRYVVEDIAEAVSCTL